MEYLSDNGPPYDSSEMKQFSSTYGFKQVTSSPYYPQGNGLAEHTVKIVKNHLRQNSDMALLHHLLSPAELLMGQRLRKDIPQVANQLVSNWRHIYKGLQKTVQGAAERAI